MAVSIPIIAEFTGANAFAKAKKEFAQLEGASKKAGFVMKKALVPATAALTAIGAGLFDATKAAIEDSAAQQKLAKNLKLTTKATDKQIQQVEDYIKLQGELLGITDDELRPAYAKLARATGSVTKAQKLLNQALDISAATGKPLDKVVTALQKAYGGNYKALQTLAPEYRNLIKDGASFEEVMRRLADTTKGAASDAAETASGKFKRLKTSLDETKESIGTALLPIVEKALPYLERFAKWAADNPDEFLAIAAAISAVAAAIFLVNTAMALNPFTAIAAGVALLVVGIVYAYKKFDGFRKFVIDTANGMADAVEQIVNGIIMIINGFIRAYNAIPFLDNIPTISHVDIPTLNPGHAEFRDPNRPTGLATGGIVTAPTLAMIGEGGEPEAVIPLSKLERMGYGGGGVNITVQAGVGDPVAIGREVAKVMDAYSRRSGRAA